MRFVTYRSERGPTAAVVDAADRVHDIRDIRDISDMGDISDVLGEAVDLQGVISRWDEVAPRLASASGDGRAIADLTLLAPIPRPAPQHVLRRQELPRARAGVRQQRL